MRSLFLVEGFDLCPSNQYILVRVSPSCFCFAKMFLCQVSLLSRCNPRYLASYSWGELHIVYMDQGACFSSCNDILHEVQFIINALKKAHDRQHKM
jgi:hypothetical protein